MNIVKKITFSILLFIISFISIFANISISSNGKYAISTNGNIYLWNIDKKSMINLGDKYTNNVYFIPNTNYFVVQNKSTKKVTVFDINQKEIKSFTPDFIANEQAMNQDLSIWVGSTKWGDAYRYLLPNLDKKQIYISWYMAENKYNNYSSHNRPDGSIPDGTVLGNYFNFDFIDKGTLITSPGVLTVYYFDKHKWRQVDNTGATMHAIDPTGKFVYTADQQYGGIKYSLDNQKVEQELFYFPTLKENITYKQLGNRKDYFFNGVSNFKFIDNNKIIANFAGVKQPYLWAGIFDVTKYTEKSNHDTIYSTNFLKLVKDPMQFINGEYQDYKDPYPVTGGFNTMFDTSVQAHRLVVAQANGDGIMVYKYNPNDESLKLEWVGEPPKAEVKEESKGWW